VQSIVITPAAVAAAGLATGLFWLLLGLTGASRRVVRLITRPVAVGIILGLGFGFMLDGMRMMASNWLLGGVGLAGTVLLLSSRRVPAMLLLLLFGWPLRRGRIRVCCRSWRPSVRNSACPASRWPSCAGPTWLLACSFSRCRNCR